MQIVDLSQVMISNFMQQVGGHTNIEIDEGLMRHMVLNSLRSYNVKFREEYGEMIIACDDKQNWRKTIFPYYKANRKRSREDSDIDWNALFSAMNVIKSELKEYFSYRVIQVEGSEADDIIGTLVKEKSRQEKILIISDDKDYRQLQVYPNVKQYSPIKKTFVVEENPQRYLKEHIIRGDSGDGVPNILSPDNSFVASIRQKPIRQVNVDKWVNMEPEDFCDEQQLINYKRNKILVDLSSTPDYIQKEIMKQYEEQTGKKGNKLFGFFVEKKLKHLMTDISDF